MRGILLGLMAFLAMTSVGLSQVTLDYVADDMYVGDGYKSFIVQATGTNLNVLGQFTITGSRAAGEDVYQVWADASTPSPWLGDSSASGDPMDSYIMAGSLRLPDLGGGSGTGNPIATAETIASGAADIGSLNNLNDNGTPGDPSDDKYDGYLRLAGVDYTPDTAETVDLFHLVLPDGAYATVDVQLLTCDFDGEYYTITAEHNLSTQVNCPLDGDATLDGTVDVLDLDQMGTYYNTPTGMAFTDGDFNGDGAVDVLDLDILGTYYNTSADWAGGGEAGGVIPEPGTIIMLLLGGLCLAGYRLRK